MRLLVCDPALTFIIAAAGDDQAALDSALANPAWSGLTLAWSDATAYEGAPPPEGLELVDRANPRMPAAAMGLVDYASDRRWQIEVGGTTWDGHPVATDDRSKVLVNGELSAIALGVRVDGEPFKFADGSAVPLSNLDMQAVAIAMRQHVKLSFGRLFAVKGGIEAGAVTTRAQVDAILSGDA